MFRALAMTCVILIATGCASDPENGSAASNRSPDTAPPSSTEAVAPRDPLEGRWTTDTITPRMVRRHLDDAGLGKAADTVIKDQAYPTSFTLTMAGGKYQVANADGNIYDVGTYEVKGKRVTLTAAATGAGPTFVWSLDGDVLDLNLVSSTGTPYKGLPDEAFVRPIYDLPTYTRAT